LGIEIKLICDLYRLIVEAGKQTKDTKRHHNQFMLYRQIQLIGHIYNYVFQREYTPSIVATITGEIIVCVFVCIRLHDVVPMPGFLFYPLLLVDGLSVILTTKVAGEVYRKSGVYLFSLRENVKLTRKHRLVKELKSLAPIKIRFGASNFIDELTPLVLLDFCFCQSVSVLLIVK